MAQQPNRGPGLGTVVLVSAVTSAVVSAALILGLTSGEALFAEPEPVPDVIGMSTPGAGAVLREQGLILMVDGEAHDPDIAIGDIASQEPRPGSHLERGAAVHVRTSLGPEPVRVPRLSGRPLAEARSAIEEAGLIVGEVTEEAGAGAPGAVVRSTPVAGELVLPGSDVHLVARPTTRMIEVPALTGQSIRRARSLIEEAGFTVGEETRRFDDLRPPYIVLSQDPAAGAEAAEGSAIDLVVNEG